MHGRDLWQHLGNPKRMATPLIVAVGQVGQHTGGRGIKKLAARWNITFTDHLDRRVHEVQQCMRRIVEHMVCYLVHDLLPFRAIKLEFTFHRNAQSAPFYSTCRSSKYSFLGASG